MMITVPTRPDSALYRAVWRWHFVAGLLVLPFMVLLAVTGAMYLFKDELDRMVYSTWEDVPARSTPPMAISTLIDKAQSATGGQVLMITQPARENIAIRMVVRLPSGEPRTAFVDPHDGRVIGSTRFGGVMQLVRKVHSLQLFGSYATAVIETAAGWAVVLVATGIYLWWPRGRKGGVVTVRAGPRERVFWRDVHAVTGIIAGGIVVFLAVTGMPWSDVWGGKIQEWASVTGLGRPDPPADVVPEWALEQTPEPAAPPASGHRHDAPKPDLPWPLEKSVPPRSSGTSHDEVIGIDRVLTILNEAGLRRPFSLTLPSGPTSAYVGSYNPNRSEDVRIVYVDQFDGKILDDVGFARFGTVAKIIDWGTAVHQGGQYGAINRYLMLCGCIAIVVLAASALTMWLKRRPKGKLGVPPPPSDRRAPRLVLAIFIPIAIFYPLVGLSLAIALAIEGIVFMARRFNRDPVGLS